MRYPERVLKNQLYLKIETRKTLIVKEKCILVIFQDLILTWSFRESGPGLTLIESTSSPMFEKFAGILIA